jgi:uncharacterized protein (TIGR02117 family)
VSGRACVATLVLVVSLACLADGQTSSKPVYVVSHGWHVGIAVRLDDVSPHAWPESRLLGDHRYIEIGWGDGDYYPAPRGTVPLALHAAFASTGSVLHVAGFDEPPERYFPLSAVVALDVSDTGLDALARFVHETYARDATGNVVPGAPGVYGRSAFYAANGRYCLVANSNQWAARALEVAGVRLTPGLSVTAGSVLYQAACLGRVLRATWPEPVACGARRGG